MPRSPATTPGTARQALLYHFCRLQLPGVAMTPTAFDRHLQRTFDLHRAKAGQAATWDAYLDNFYPLDWFLASGCLEGDNQAWEALFAARTSRADCLLVDALRARAVRLYPRDEERQERRGCRVLEPLAGSGNRRLGADPGPVRCPVPAGAVADPCLSELAHLAVAPSRRAQVLPEDDLAGALPSQADDRWHEAFCLAAREWIGQLGNQELLILGLRLRHWLSQREAAQLLGVHEGTISRETTQLASLPGCDRQEAPGARLDGGRPVAVCPRRNGKSSAG